MIVLNDLSDTDYRIFIKYSVKTCDYFSLTFEKSDNIYINYDYYALMQDYVIRTENIVNHPDTGTEFTNADKVDIKCCKFTCDLLLKPSCFSDFNGFLFPEELCFYRNDTLWFRCISHEKLFIIENCNKYDKEYLLNHKIINQ